ncbi:his Kinase A domain protein, partial [Vibrio parahaemolyticus V-223/04]
TKQSERRRLNPAFLLQ